MELNLTYVCQTPKELIQPQVVKMTSHPHATCVHACKPPSGGGPGSVIDRVVSTRSRMLLALLAVLFNSSETRGAGFSLATSSWAS